MKIPQTSQDPHTLLPLAFRAVELESGATWQLADGGCRLPAQLPLHL
jgi:hypothetical protein